MDIEKAVTAIKTWIGPMRKVHKDNDFANEFIDAAWELAKAALREKAERERTGGWISVEDELPEFDEDVLMVFDTEIMAVGFRFNEVSWCAYSDGEYYTSCERHPTHWMPLPEPPKGEQE